MSKSSLPSTGKMLLTKLRHWEYWPFQIVYLPIFFYWIYLSVKARSMLFFTSSNPFIETGGMMGESKSKILDSIPEAYKPFSHLIKKTGSETAVAKLMAEGKVSFPLICKPDIGERGTLVEKINNPDELKQYLRKVKVDFIVQEFIEYPIEAGVFYHRLPNKKSGNVTSIVLKEFLKVTGDGISTVQELMNKNERARFQIKRFLKEKPLLLASVLAINEQVVLEPIGNHCRGTTFLNGNHHIDQNLVNTFDEISRHIPGFYYGRYDLKCKSIEDLKYGRNIRIMELNGAGSEPAHIYQPGFPILEAYKVLFSHWKILYEVSRTNQKNGYDYMTLKEGWNKMKEIKTYSSFVTSINHV